MRISDWSSDVCSSDLRQIALPYRVLQRVGYERLAFEVQPAVRPAVRVDRRRYVNRSAGVVSAIGDEVSGCGFVCADAPSPVWRSARESANGNVFPRFSARRRMPEQAFALKKYRCGR